MLHHPEPATARLARTVRTCAPQADVPNDSDGSWAVFKIATDSRRSRRSPSRSTEPYVLYMFLPGEAFW